MADVNEAYNGFVEKLDFDGVWQSVVNSGWPFSVAAKAYLNSEEARLDRQRVVEFNADSVKTVADVKLKYTGTTDAERLAWINTVLGAINNRVALIKKRTDVIVSSLKEDGETSAGEKFLGVFNTVFSAAIPVVGSFIGSLFSGKVFSDKQRRITENTNLLNTYATDVQSLATIRAQLTKQQQQLITTGPKNEAPTPIPGWWYLAGLAVLILFFVYLKRRKKR